MAGQEQDVQFSGLRATRTRTWRYLLGVFLRWLVTLLLSLAIWWTLWFYSVDVVIMQDFTKRDFNVLITALTIALGLSLSSSLDKLARDTRWWILSRRYRSRRKVEVILEAENSLALLRMAFTSRRITIHLTAIFWISVLTASQVGLAILGLFYSVDPSDQMALVVYPGNVSIADMSAIRPIELVAGDSGSEHNKEYAANMFGTLSLTYPTALRSREPTIGDLRLGSDPVIFCDGEGCDLLLLESSVPETEAQLEDMSSWQPLVVASNRTISTATTCESFRVVSGGDGTATEIEYTSRDGQDRVRVQVPLAGATGQTLFMTNTSFSCGLGCGTVTAFEVSADNPWFYRCNTTVGPVANAALPEHEVSENVRLLAAQSIALKGYSASADGNVTNMQYQAYPAQAAYGTPLLGIPGAMALTMTRFATGTLAMVAQTSEHITVAGYPPRQVSAVNVDHWDLVAIVLVATVGFQLVFSLAVAAAATRVVMPPPGATAMAKVLRAMAAAEGPDNTEWIYRSRKVSEDGLYDLYIDGRPRERLGSKGTWTSTWSSSLSSTWSSSLSSTWSKTGDRGRG